jgi:hypothetical protein
MPSRVYVLNAGERVFQVLITALLDGYSARILERVSDQLSVPAGLDVPPRQEVDPTTFFSFRLYYRSELIELVNTELLSWRVKRLDEAEAREDHDAYIRANLKGWPDGYPYAVNDDLSDWRF